MSSLILFLFSSLIFILNIPHTIALRNLIAFVLLLLIVFLWFKNRSNNVKFFTNKSFKQILLIFFGLTLYILLHTFFIAEEFDWSISEFYSHWLIPLLYLCIGMGLAYFVIINKYFNGKTLITYLFFAMFLHILYIDFVALDKLLQHKQLISRYGGLTGSPVLANYLTNVLLAFSISEFIYRLKTNNKVLQISNLVLFLIFLLVVFSSIVEGMRFGMIAIFFITISGVVLFSINNIIQLKLKILYGLFFTILLSVPIIYNAVNDSRWESLVETVPIALDTENNKHWIDRDEFPAPKLQNGDNVSASNYERIAWAYQGLKYIYQQPEGIGLGRNAFGHMVQKYENYDAARGNHSHSSIIDLTLGIGIIGIAIWILLFIKIVFYSLKEFMINKNYYALVTLFISSGFFFRSLVDSNVRDHMFLHFMLMLGIILTLSSYHTKNI